MNSPSSHKPPRLAQRLFSWYCDDPLQEEIAGDLEERFLDHCNKYGLREAKKKYWINVFKFIRWHTLKRRNSKKYSQNNLAMVKNNFKVAFRSAKKHKTYSLINLMGLAIGLTSFILISLYVKHQLSFDDFHEKKDRIFRITEGKDAITPNIIAPLLARSFEDEIDYAVRVFDMSGEFIRINDQSYSERIYFADKDFFNLFSFTLIQGSADQVLAEPNSMVISQKAAMKYFGSTDVVGKSLEREGVAYKISGLLMDVPTNSYFQFDFVVPFTDWGWTVNETWSNWNYQTFIGLAENVNPETFEVKMSDLIDQTVEEAGGSRDTDPYTMQALTDIYLQKRFHLEYELEKVGDIKYVYIFSSVAVLILLIACINYVNLATSRSLERAKEVGIRKVVGAHRKQLMGQFLSESLLFVLMAAFASYFLAYWLMPAFNELSGESISKLQMFEAWFVVSLLSLSVVIALLSGFYPAILLSMFKPVAVLKGKFSHSGSGNRLRKSLVVFQFAISACLVVATLVVKKQLDFIQSKNVGFDREQVIYFGLDGDSKRSFDVLKNKLLSHPNVDMVSSASNTPSSVGSAHGIQTGETQDDWELIYFLTAEEDYMELVGLDLLAGRSLGERSVTFRELDSTDKKPSYIINETTAKIFNWNPEEAIGKNITISGYEAPVQGVVKDFHFKSMQQSIEPFVIMADPNRNNLGFVKIGQNDIAGTMDFIQATLQDVAPKLPFQYTFLDEQFERMYRFESRLGTVFFTFSSIAIAIACLGMFGLISYMAVNRAKEMGIRKVLGATVTRIVVLLTADFMKLVGVALVIALPVAYYFMRDWLNNYAYKVDVGVDVALLTIVFAVLVTAISISYQAFRTALVNPARVLRNE